MINNIDLNRLRVFYSVFQTKSLLRSSQLLHVSTPAIYQSIRKLESEMKSRLFIRTGKSYIPTHLAKDLAGICASFFGHLEQFHESLADSDTTLQGKVRVGAPVVFSKTTLLPLFRKFNQDHPLVRIDLRANEPSKLLPDLVRFDLDFAICDDGPHLQLYPNLHAAKIFTERLVLVCSKNFFRSRMRSAACKKNLPSLTHIAYMNKAEALKKWYRHHLGRFPKLKDCHVIDNVEIIVEAVKGGMGLGLVPEYLVQRDLDSGRLIKISFAKKELDSNILLLQVEDSVPTRVSKALTKYLREFSK